MYGTVTGKGYFIECLRHTRPDWLEVGRLAALAGFPLDDPFPTFRRFVFFPPRLSRPKSLPNLIHFSLLFPPTPLPATLSYSPSPISNPIHSDFPFLNLVLTSTDFLSPLVIPFPVRFLGATSPPFPFPLSPPLLLPSPPPPTLLFPRRCLRPQLSPGPSPWLLPAKLTRTWVLGSLVHATFIGHG